MQKQTKVIFKKGIGYKSENGKIKHFKPWLGDCFSFLYDTIMEKSIFPNLFGGDINKHVDILRKELKDVQNQNVLELATGSGSAVDFLDSTNRYTGTDISTGLLRQAVKRFRADFDAQFYVASADDLPFEDNTFDVCLCILALNFFEDINTVLDECQRVLKPGATFFCSIAVPERKKGKKKINGTLYSEGELKEIFEKHQFRFEPVDCENGALLYFKATLR